MHGRDYDSTSDFRQLDIMLQLLGASGALVLLENAALFVEYCKAEKAGRGGERERREILFT